MLRSRHFPERNSQRWALKYDYALGLLDRCPKGPDWLRAAVVAPDGPMRNGSTGRAVLESVLQPVHRDHAVPPSG